MRKYIGDGRGGGESLTLKRRGGSPNSREEAHGDKPKEDRGSSLRAMTSEKFLLLEIGALPGSVHPLKDILLGPSTEYQMKKTPGQTKSILQKILDEALKKKSIKGGVRQTNNPSGKIPKRPGS